MAQIEFIVSSASAGERLDRFVASGTELSNSRAKQLVESGRVYIGGEAVRHASHRVMAGDVVRVEVDQSAAMTAVTELVDAASLVIYRDDVILAIAKPSGLPTHATHDPNRDHAHAAVQRLLGPDAYVGVHHRLDVDTSGVLLFATDRAANKGLASAFADREVEKTYLAVVSVPDLPDVFVVDNHLGRDRQDSRRMCEVHSGGDTAHTDFEVEARSRRGAVVVARPRTGRTHQIRVHLAGFGAPIVGDVLYGGQAAARLMLHARRLALPHPITKERLELRAAVPEDFGQVARAYELEVE